jgi:short-subunit dehydrogenase
MTREETAGARVALITGAASGIGRELARILSGEGFAIAAIDKNAAALAKLGEELREANGSLGCAVADVTDAAGLAKSVADLESCLGPIHLAIANAGIALETSALSLRAEDFAAVVQVNLLGVANTIASVLPGLLQRRQGHLVAISSLASLRGLPRLLAYSASKSGVNALLEGLRVELAPYNISVTTICPGWIRTPMCEPVKGKVPLMELEDAARRIVRAIHKRRRFCAFPSRTAWTLRLLSYLPSPISDRLMAQMMARLDSK